MKTAHCDLLCFQQTLPESGREGREITSMNDRRPHSWLNIWLETLESVSRNFCRRASQLAHEHYAARCPQQYCPQFYVSANVPCTPEATFSCVVSPQEDFGDAVYRSENQLSDLISAVSNVLVDGINNIIFSKK